MIHAKQTARSETQPRDVRCHDNSDKVMTDMAVEEAKINKRRSDRGVTEGLAIMKREDTT